MDSNISMEAEHVDSTQPGRFVFSNVIHHDSNVCVVIWDPQLEQSFP